MNKKYLHSFQKEIFHGLGLVFVILLSSCTFSFTEDKLSEFATLLNLSKPQGEKESQIVIQCDADTPTGVKSLRGQVMDFDSNAPIVNAFVSSKVSTEVYATDAEGKFKIQKVGTETNTIILGVTAENYKSLSRAVDFKCQNMNALIYLPRETKTVDNPAFTPDNAPNTTCVFATSNLGGCKL